MLTRPKVGSRQINFHMLAGNGIDAFGPKDVVTTHLNHELRLPPEIREYVASASYELYGRQRRSELYNGLAHRLVDFGVTDTTTTDAAGNISCHSLRWNMSLAPVNYFVFLLTNKHVFDPVLAEGASIYDKYVDDPQDLRSSVLGNLISASSALITSDNKLMLARRSPKAEINPGAINCSFSEASTFEDADLFGTLVRGAAEELGLVIDKGELKLLGLGLSTNHLQPVTFGTYTSHCTSDEIRRGWESAKDKAEGEIFFIDFDPSSVANAIVHMPFVGIAEAVAVYATIHAFGHDEVAKYLTA